MREQEVYEVLKKQAEILAVLEQKKSSPIVSILTSVTASLVVMAVGALVVAGRLSQQVSTLEKMSDSHQQRHQVLESKADALSMEVGRVVVEFERTKKDIHDLTSEVSDLDNFVHKKLDN